MIIKLDKFLVQFLICILIIIFIMQFLGRGDPQLLSPLLNHVLGAVSRLKRKLLSITRQMPSGFTYIFLQNVILL